MFEAIKGFILAHALVLGVIGAIAFLAILFTQEKMQFWWVDFWVRLPIPLPGTIASLSKNTDKSNNGWLASEEQLCGAYKPFISLMPKDQFNQRIEYMRITHDLGRTPMTSGHKFFLFFLVAAEALGFSYMLGSYVAVNGSANTLTILMVGIVLVIASILAILTHLAGEQYYKTSLLRSCFKQYKEGSGIEYATETKALNSDQWSDKDKPSYIRCINRIAKNPHDKGAYSMVWVALIAIAVIGTASTMMRINDLEANLSKQSSAQDATASDPFSQLPDDVKEPQKKADEKAKKEINSNELSEGVFADLMLGFIFVLTQIVGMHSGYKHSFAGRETYKSASGSNSFWFWSEKDGAYAETGGFSTYDRYWQTFQPLVDLVNKRLKNLQYRLKKNAHLNMEFNKTFLNFLEESQAKTDLAIENLNRNQASRGIAEQRVANQDLPNNLINVAKNKIEGLVDKQEQKDYYSSLPLDIQQSLEPWLKQRKAQEEEIKHAKLESLF